jgi:hypothetical protein
LGRLGRKASWAAAGPPAGGTGRGGKGRLGHADQLGRARGGDWAKKEERGERKEKGFPFSKVYFLDECFHKFNKSK